MPVSREAAAGRSRTTWPWRGGSGFTAPDGSRLTVGAADVSHPWSCNFVARIAGTRHAFSVAERGAFEWYTSFLLTHASVQEYPYRGGDLALAHDGTTHQTLTAWRGPWFELHHQRVGPAPTVPVATRVFDALRLQDTPDGMRVDPWPHDHPAFGPTTFESLAVFKEIPGIGDLRIERPGRSEVSPPRWRGAPARRGEIWRRSLLAGDAGRARGEILLLATPTTVTQLIPGPEHTADPAVALAFLRELDISWDPA
jgi:hypothetical protein